MALSHVAFVPLLVMLTMVASGNTIAPRDINYQLDELAYVSPLLVEPYDRPTPDMPWNNFKSSSDGQDIHSLQHKENITHSVMGAGMRPRYHLVHRFLSSPALMHPTSNSKRAILVVNGWEMEHVNDPLPVVVNNGLIIIHNCSGLVFVRTTYMRSLIGCHELSQMRFYGPMEITYGNSSHLADGISLCDTRHDYPIPTHNTCSVYTHPVVTALLSLSFIAVLILAFSLRLTIVRKISTIPNHHRIGEKGTFFRGVIYFRENNDDMVRYQPLSERLREAIGSEEAKVDEKPVSTAKFGVCSLMKASIIGITCLPTSVVSLIVSNGEVFRVGMGVVGVNDSYQEFPLLFQYYTGEFKSELTQSWYCSSYDCNIDGNCDEFGALGKWKTHYMTQCKDGSRDICAYRHFCKLGTTGCFATTGCLKWSLEYRIKEEEFYRVFMIGQSQDVIFVDSTGSAENPILDLHLVDHFNPYDQAIVMDSKGNSYLCPDTTHNVMATPSRLGDIQVSFNRTFHMAWSQSICRAQASIGVSCDTIVPYSKFIKKLCTALPSQVGSYKLEFTRGFLLARKDRNLAVVLKDSVDVPDKPTGCSIIESSVTGIRGGSEPYKLVLRATPLSVISTATFHYSFSGQKYIVRCDGKPHFYEVPSLDLCDSEPNVMKVSEFDKGFIDMGGKNHQRNSRWITESAQPGSLFPYSGLIHIIGAIGLSGVLLIVAIVVIICKK